METICSLSDNPKNLQKGTVIAKHWRIKRKIGEGGFGAVYKVVDVETMAPAALKIETHNDREVLKLEAKVLRVLGNSPFIPHLLDCGKKPTYSYIVITLLGPSLNKILKIFGKTCSISAQVRIGINSLYAIKQLHDSGFVHRDLKPANMAVGAVGTPEFRFIHIFDFGLARQYIVPSDDGPPKLRKPRPRAHFRGTLRYCSVNCHERGEQGRDDDLWCLLYLLVELRGPLPWAKASAPKIILQLKKSTNLNDLLWNCPIEFVTFARHLMSLNYYLRPDYALLYSLLMKVMDAGNYKFSDPYDWELKTSLPESFITATDSTEKSQTYSATLCTARDINPFPAEFFSYDPLGF